MGAFGEVEIDVQTGEDEGGLWFVLVVDWIPFLVVE